MGSDLTVVNAARVSFDKQSNWDIIGYEEKVYIESRSIERFPIKSLSSRDAKLIHYLGEHNHWTPFGHPQITLRETVPIFVARQRYKHQIGFVYNEVSRRYVDGDPKFYSPVTWRKRAENKKQGSSKESFEDHLHDEITEATLGLYEHVLEIYKGHIEAGVAPEQARMVLPQSMYTSYYVTGSLAAWARAYKLRSSEDAQSEIRDLAAQWDSILADLFPVSWKVLTSAKE